MGLIFMLSEFNSNEAALIFKFAHQHPESFRDQINLVA